MACDRGTITLYLPLVHIATIYTLRDAMPQGCPTLRDAIARYVLVLRWRPEHALLADFSMDMKWSENHLES